MARTSGQHRSYGACQELGVWTHALDNNGYYYGADMLLAGHVTAARTPPLRPRWLRLWALRAAETSPTRWPARRSGQAYRVATGTRCDRTRLRHTRLHRVAVQQEVGHRLPRQHLQSIKEQPLRQHRPECSRGQVGHDFPRRTTATAVSNAYGSRRLTTPLPS